MNVTKTFPTQEVGHVIEIGHPTWDEEGSQFSVRSRRQNRNGGFNRGSPETPIGDLGGIIAAVAGEDLIESTEIAAMLVALSASLIRKLGS
jgi:hypothetical protein